MWQPYLQASKPATTLRPTGICKKLIPASLAAMVWLHTGGGHFEDAVQQARRHPGTSPQSSNPTRQRQRTLQQLPPDGDHDRPAQIELKLRTLRQRTLCA